MTSVRVIHGDCREVLPTLPAASVQMVCTSPPYFGLRDYQVAGQIGLEATPDAYVAQMVAVFREVRRVLRDDGTLWLNLGDSYTGSSNSGGANRNDGGPPVRLTGIAPKPGKPKDLIGIPWRVAFALQADGWYLRDCVIWHKPNPMPESVRDRTTKAHEFVFMLTKKATYFYDADAIAEPVSPNTHPWASKEAAPLSDKQSSLGNGHSGFRAEPGDTRNARSVWTIASQPFSESHFATMPPDLAERCIKAGSKLGDTILDPFSGAGTTGLVADRLQRHYIGIELNDTYRAMSQERIRADAPLFAGAP